MAVRLETRVKHFLADDASDDLPRVGVMVDGYVLDENDLPIGSTVLYRDTGIIKRWNGLDWAESVPSENTEAQLLSAILLELRDLKERVALATA